MKIFGIIADRFAQTEKRIKNGKAFAGSFPVVRYCLLRLPLFLTVKNKMMITQIQCATMHSGLTEQEIKEKYGWVLRALNEYGSRCVYDFLDGNSPEPAKHKPFIVGNVRDLLDELNLEEITFGLFVEKLNAIASKFYEKSSEGASEGMAEALRGIRNRLYDSLPTGEIDANASWEMLQSIKRHVNELDEFCASLSPGVEDNQTKKQ